MVETVVAGVLLKKNEGVKWILVQVGPWKYICFLFGLTQGRLKIRILGRQNEGLISGYRHGR
jgi:hypothetical protein